MAKVNGQLEPKQRFKVGDTLTYKDSDIMLPKKAYYFGGENQIGCTGIIIRYSAYQIDSGCYQIEVTIPNSVWSYGMLESEFFEYDRFIKNNPFKTMLINRKKFKSKHHGKSKWNITKI